MKVQTTKILFGIIFLVAVVGFVSAVAVDANYVTLYPGKQGSVSVKVDNNENFDIESVSLALDLSNVPFSSIGSSEKSYDDIDSDDDDSATFTLIPSTDITPGDYQIPYTLKYTNADNDTETFQKTGSFGIRVSAQTDLDYSVELGTNPIVGQKGTISLDVINKGLGEVKAVSVQIFPNGYELLSKDKVFIGTISADDYDSADFNVIYQTANPTVTAKIDYKDFDNNDQTKTVNIPIKVYTQQEALDLGLTSKSSHIIYYIIVLLVILYLIYRIRKSRKKKSSGR